MGGGRTGKNDRKLPQKLRRRNHCDRHKQGGKLFPFGKTDRNRKKIVPDAEILIIGNKKDLLSQQEMEIVIANMPIKPHYVSSAKSGENVEECFVNMGAALVEKYKTEINDYLSHFSNIHTTTKNI